MEKGKEKTCASELSQVYSSLYNGNTGECCLRRLNL